MSDGNGGSDTGTVSITVTAVNDAPVAADDGPFATAEDTAVTTTSVLANDTDVDGDVLSVSGADAVSVGGGSVMNNGDGTFTYTPALNFNGADSFDYTVSDGNGGSDTGTVSITVTAVNDAPVAADDGPFATAEDTAVTTTSVLANDTDVDGDVLSVSGADAVSVGGGSVMNNGDGTFTYTPALNFNGADSFDYTVSDGNGGSDTGTVSITVTAVNDAPVAADDGPFATAEDTAVTTTSVLANDTDVDGDVLSVSGADAVSVGGGSVMNNGDGTFTYTPALNFNGADSFDYTVSDGNGGSDTGTVSITVTAVNDAPTANNNAAVTDEDTPVTTVNVLANDIDIDSGILSVDSFTQPANGTVVDNGDGTFTYTPNADFNGLDSFTYIASDGLATSNAATVTITVSAVNDAPVVGDIPDQTIDEDGSFAAISLDDYVTDVETVDAAMTWSYGGNSALSVSIDPTTHIATISAPADWNGFETITFTAKDTGDGTSPALSAGDSAVFTVNPVNDPPVAGDDSSATDEDTVLNFSAPGILGQRQRCGCRGHHQHQQF